MSVIKAVPGQPVHDGYSFTGDTEYARRDSFVEAQATESGSVDHVGPLLASGASILYSGVPNYYNQISRVGWQYTGTSPSGVLKVLDDSVNVFQLNVIGQGYGGFGFNTPLKATAKNKTLQITLSSGGSGVTSDLYVYGHNLVDA